VTNDDKDIVSALVRSLADKVGPERFELWFRTTARFTLGQGRLVVSVPNRFFQDWMRRNFRKDLDAACLEACGRVLPLDFEVDASLSPAETAGLFPVAQPAVPATETPAPAILRLAPASVAPSPAVEAPAAEPATSEAAPSPAARGPQRRFAALETFVVGESNRLAATSAQMVARRQGHWNPLFLYGPTGVGKTHLLEGIWSTARKADRGLRVVYRTAEQFTVEFVAAVRDGKGLPSFRAKYRGVDLLILDNVQFFCGKKATIGELLQTIDAMLAAGRQVVLAADRSPAELAGEMAELGGELANRLSGGLVCRLDPADFETRLGIVRSLAARLDVEVPAEVQSFVAGQFTSHAWELAGALNRVQATSMALALPVTLDLAQQALSDLIRDAARVVRLPDIERAVCAAFGLESEALHSSRKSKGVTHPRMLAMWLARKHTRAAYSEIGNYFGRKSHSTAISAERKISSIMAGQSTLEMADRSWSVDDAIRAVEKLLATG
jgi:chromosomal replication initiator protein